MSLDITLHPIFAKACETLVVPENPSKTTLGCNL